MAGEYTAVHDCVVGLHRRVIDGGRAATTPPWREDMRLLAYHGGQPCTTWEGDDGQHYRGNAYTPHRHDTDRAPEIEPSFWELNQIADDASQ